MRLIQHPALQLQSPYPRIGSKRIDDSPRVGELLLARREGRIDQRHLGRMDCEHAGKPVRAGCFCRALRTFDIAEISVERVDGPDSTGMGDKQGLSPNEAECIGPMPIGIALARSAKLGREVFRPPGETCQTRHGGIHIGRDRQRGARCFAYQRKQAGLAIGDAMPLFELVDFSRDLPDLLGPFRLRQHDAFRSTRHNGGKILAPKAGFYSVDPHPPRLLAHRDLAPMHLKPVTCHASRGRLGRNRHRVFQIDDQRMGTRLRRLEQLLFAIARHEQPGSRNGAHVLLL